MSLIYTPNLLTWGLRIYFYLLIILSFNMASAIGFLLALSGFLVMEAFCEELRNDYESTRRNELFDKHSSTPYNLILN
jgi:hypothetical protein